MQSFFFIFLRRCYNQRIKFSNIIYFTIASFIANVLLMIIKEKTSAATEMLIINLRFTQLWNICSFTFNNCHNIAISTNTFESTVVFEQHVVRSPITYITKWQYIWKSYFFSEQLTFYLPFLSRRHTRNQNYEEIEKFGLVGETFFQRLKCPLNEK